MYLLAAALLLCWQQGLDPAMDKALEAHKAGRMDDAIREYRAYLKTKPTSVEARANLGAALAAQGQFDSAIAEYRIALKAAPSNPGVAFNLALAYYKSGDVPRAGKELSALRALVGEQPQ
jgi:Flp pilus assembly protein TadD